MVPALPAQLGCPALSCGSNILFSNAATLTMKIPRDLADDIAGNRQRGFVREHIRLPLTDARLRARREFKAFPSGTYMTEIENWRELPGGFVEFTVKRLRDTDKDE
jgi:hypothetical protein